MSVDQDSNLAVSGMPPARRELYAEIKSKLSVIFAQPICQTETALRILLDRHPRTGSRVVAGLIYEWRLSRLPFYIEWKIKKNDGEMFGWIFQSVDVFVNDPLEALFVKITNSVIQNGDRVHEELEKIVRELRKEGPDGSTLSLSHAVALARRTLQNKKQTYETKTAKFLADKGYGKHEIGNVDFAISQLLAELYNVGMIRSEYLALTWDDYAKEKDARQTEATWADPPSSSSTDVSTPAPTKSDEPLKKKKKKKNRRKRKAETTTKEESQNEVQETDVEEINVATHHDSSLKSQHDISDSPGDLHDIVDDTTEEAHHDIVDSSRSQEPDQVSVLMDIENSDLGNSDKAEQKAWPKSATLQAQPEQVTSPYPSEFPALSSPQSSPKLTNSTATTSSSNTGHQDKCTNLLASSPKLTSNTSLLVLSKEDPQSETAPSAVPSSSRRWFLKAVPDLKSLKKSKHSTSGMKETTAAKVGATDPIASKDTISTRDSATVTKAEVQEDTKAQIKSVRQYSKLRPEAPVFTPSVSLLQPQSQASSTLASPEMAPLNSVPMSMTTSATTNASTSGQNTTPAGFGREIMLREGLNVTFTLPSPPSNDTSAIAPALEDSSNNESSKGVDRPRSNSTSMVPSSTAANFNPEDDEEDQVEMKQLLQTWPSSDKDPVIVTPWRYVTFGEQSLEEIVLNHGHENNHFRIDPWYTNIRDEASQANDISMDVPAVLMKASSGCPVAAGQFDKKNNVWRIFPPNESPGGDVRKEDSHPDYLEPAKLLQVQGYEMFRYNVYVAIRLSFTCQYQECKKEITDGPSSTQVCLGCGPLAPVRYCSMRCLMYGLIKHWTECGSSKFWPPSNQVIDPDVSFPLKFKGLIPFIKDISDWDSMARRRIHWVTHLLNGDYGLFPENNMTFYEIKTMKNLGEEIVQRIQRLLNCALLDRRNHSLIAYLYLLIRDALDLQVKTRDGEIPTVFRFQFVAEWKFDYKNKEEGVDFLESIHSCDCMWFGFANSPKCNGADGRDSTCKAGRGLAEPHRTIGLKALVEQLEHDHWILRAWQTRHPRVSDWRERVYGKGFHGLKPRKFKDVLPVLGIGFEGHISKDKVVGEWRPRLKLEATPPPMRYVSAIKDWVQDPSTFVWDEAEN